MVPYLCGWDGRFGHSAGGCSHQLSSVVCWCFYPPRLGWVWPAANLSRSNSVFLLLQALWSAFRIRHLSQASLETLDKPPCMWQVSFCIYSCTKKHSSVVKYNLFSSFYGRSRVKAGPFEVAIKSLARLRNGCHVCPSPAISSSVTSIIPSWAISKHSRDSSCFSLEEF